MSTDDVTPTDAVAHDDAPSAAPDAPRTQHRPGVRVGTVVGGLIVVLLGAGVLLVAAGYTVDVQLAAIVLLIAAGVGLILGPLVQGLRRGRTGDQ
ncbi:hypothetical protein [Cellulomonas wangsupingiae]|uniref:Uncharacterized protein n=1 Tax=Cellulomonas wangsupingiae TaxID=2968085 RepID=A0ABY5K3V1_9CELL|nr:hypothetical protein [Cellulomonas wangsupingiae]MCC2335866.1 hypothetical protein [Cellulomonas wangsupingiae]MCM0639845.1 hypothetical protein [Cellulomonas wangsupingiae]UUI64091.1 hypothetical protein NP075_13260 [Cellulomonas wangsupingiae]